MCCFDDLQALIFTIDSVLVALAALLYLAPRTNATITRLQIKLRRPLHLLVHIGGSLTFVASTQTVEAGVCHPFWPEYCPVEGLAIHLIMPSIYAALAAIPMTLAVPLQAVTFAIYASHNPTLCDTAFLTCKETPQQYRIIHSALAKFASTITFGFSDVMILPPKADCLISLGVVEVTMLVIMGLLAAFASEISSRIAYCLMQNSVECALLILELNRRKTRPWQIIGEAIVAWFLAYNLITLVISMWYLF